jgi:hypothetical protein
MKLNHLFIFAMMACTLSAFAQVKEEKEGYLIAGGGTQLRVVNVTPISNRESIITVNLSGVQSMDLQGAALNTIISQAVGASASVIGIGWDVTIETFEGSWRSEATVGLDNSDGAGPLVTLRPGSADTSAGTGNYSSEGIVYFADNMIPDIPILGDGNLYLEFYETYDDESGVADAEWNGTLDLAVETGSANTGVPTMSTWAMLVMAMLTAGVALFFINKQP